MIRNIGKFVVSICVPLLAGVIGSLFTVSSISTWYLTIQKPSLNPPAWVFGPVWTALFVLMGIAVFLVWKKRLASFGVKKALGIFIFQLIINVLWSAVFFGLQNPGGAFLVIILLWLAIVATIFNFAKISRAAAWLLAPYILWVTFASYLNYSIWMLN